MTADDPTGGTVVTPGLLESFLPGDRRRAIASGRDLPGHVRGAALFADISGFTPLTEALADHLGAVRGAEELSRTLNRVYETLVGVILRREAVVLYYSGDAITCWFDGDDGSRAVRCALDLQRSLDEVRIVEVGDRSFRLGIKVAVAVGDARRFVVGDPEIQRMDVLAGRLVDHLVAAEGLAEPGEVIVDESVIAALGDRLTIAATRRDEATGRNVAVVVESLDDDGSVADVEPFLPALASEVARPWLLRPVADRLMAGAGELFLAELRTTHPIFVRFGGFDFDSDVDAPDRLDAFVRTVQAVFESYGGAVLGLTVGDKGAYFNAVLGAPRSHEDDAHRAVAAAVAIRDLEATSDAVGIQVGVSRGRTFSGTYGHHDRRTFTVMGDPTNVAARLMSAAPAGEVYVLGEVADQVSDRFEWDREEPLLTLKGKSEPVRIRRPLEVRRRPVRRVARYPLPMVGRDRELATISAALDDVRAGRQRVLGVAAEAGMGKSRLVAEVLGIAHSSGLRALVGEAESLGRTNSYVLWRAVWRELLAVEDDAPEAMAVRQVERQLAAIDPRLVPRLPLLGKVLGLDVPDNDFVRPFDAKLRKTSLESLLTDLLLARLGDEPLLVVLDDVHWIDQPSLDLLTVLVRATADRPIAFLLGYRPTPGSPRPVGVEALGGFSEIALGELDAEGIRAIVAAKVAQTFSPDAEISDAFHDLVRRRAQGNPFYAAELVNYLEGLELDPGDLEAVGSVALPDSLNALVLDRIDGMPERPRQGLKVASVYGREFPPALIGRVHGGLGDGDDLLRHFDAGRRADLVSPVEEDLEDWLFRHAITRDVAYESLPFSVRAELHERTGDAIAADTADRIGASLDILAHHYWHSDDDEKKRRFLRLAGDAARDSYANEAAVLHYERLGRVAADDERAQVLIDLAHVLEVLGRWDGAHDALVDARSRANADGDAATTGWADVGLAEVARKQGDYDGAAELLALAGRSFEAAGDAAGTGRVLHLLGTVSAQHGDLAEARRLYEESRRVREQNGDLAGQAALLSNLGVVAEYEGDFAESIRLNELALGLRRELGDSWAIAISLTNLGMIAIHQERHADARDLFEDAMRLTEEVGDAWMVAPAHNNLGNANRGLGDTEQARFHYRECLEIYERYGETWGLTFLLEDIALLAAISDPGQALELLGSADRLRDDAELPRPQATEDQLQVRLEPFLGELSPAERERHRSAGRRRGRYDSTHHAMVYLR